MWRMVLANRSAPWGLIRKAPCLLAISLTAIMKRDRGCPSTRIAATMTTRRGASSSTVGGAGRSSLASSSGHSLRKIYSVKATITMEANIEALRKGLAYAEDSGLAEGGGPWSLDRVEHGERLLISGNEAVGVGLLGAGGRVFAG